MRILVLGGGFGGVYTALTLERILGNDPGVEIGLVIVQLRTEKSVGVARAHFEADQTIFREGDRADRLYVVVDGEVAVLRQVPGEGEVTLRTLGPGDSFGEIALVTECPRTATVKSRTGVNVLTVDREAFHALFAHVPPLRGFFQRLVAERQMPGM